MDEQNVQVADNIRPYLDEIAERLWSEHAAVMVGSGFSKNGQPNSEMCNNFPDWAELGDIFYEKVYRNHPGKQVKYLNVLKLAEEVQAAFGRPTLDQLLQDAIPDKEYEPSELHTELLNLPWSDVFTTNYDTLLERATAKVFDRRYDIVKTKEDITHSSQPRIVKLHGSFPSIRPFVITEEDYRIYPKENAPFVNMVQQSLLENTLCLIGFSGDDPNFLSWIGWIRDNLGRDNSPKIFLVGVINLSIAQQKLLEARNIVVINMADCNDIRENEHYKGLRRFLEYLKSKDNSQAALNWPTTSSPLFPEHGKDTDKEKQIEATLNAWKVQRESYPGWVIAPEEVRKTIWMYTGNWCQFHGNIADDSSRIDLKWAFELLWRMDKSLCPIYNEQIDFFASTWRKYKWMYISDARVSKEERQMSIELGLHLFRFYREEGLHKEWDVVNKGFIRGWSKLLPLHQARIYYERCLFALFEINISGLRECISNWPVNDSLPFWEAKRGILVATIGDINEAASIIQKALREIRSILNLNPVSTNYEIISQEAYIMTMSRGIQHSLRFANYEVPASSDEVEEMKCHYLKEYKEKTMQGISDDRDEKVYLDLESLCQQAWDVLFEARGGDQKKEWKERLLKVRRERYSYLDKNIRDRLTKLRQYGCDPSNELKIFFLKLNSRSIERVSHRRKDTFDIGRYSYTLLSGSNNKGDVLTAYAFLRFIDDSGLISWISSTDCGKHAMEKISETSPYWATAIIFQLNNPKFIDKLYNRLSLAKMSIGKIDDFVDIYLNIEEKNHNEATRKEVWQTQAFSLEIVTEVLSRLCTKCSYAAHARILGYIMTAYTSENKQAYGSVREIIYRLAKSYDIDRRDLLLNKFLEFPIPRNMYPVEEMEFKNPLQYLYLPDGVLRNVDRPTIEVIDRFFQDAECKDENARHWAKMSLCRLYEWGLLGKMQQQKLGKILWKRTDQYGLPAETDYYKFYFHKLPYPKNKKPRDIFLQYLRDSEFPIQAKKKDRTISITGGDVRLCEEVLGANRYKTLSVVDIDMICKKIIEWWDLDKGELQNKENQKSWFVDIHEEFQGRFSKMEKVLAYVIVPRAQEYNRVDLINEASRIQYELHERNMSTLRLQAALSLDNKERLDQILIKLCGVLSSNRPGEVSNALQALTLIFEVYDRDDKELVFSNIMSRLSKMIYWRHSTKLDFAISLMSRIVLKHPQLMNGDIEENTLSGLEHLLVETNYSCSESEIAERLLVRREAAELAALIYKKYTNAGKRIPSAIQSWKNNCESTEEFAEIRNAWKEHLLP